jgi:hypothetical protein
VCARALLPGFGVVVGVGVVDVVVGMGVVVVVKGTVVVVQFGYCKRILKQYGVVALVLPRYWISNDPGSIFQFPTFAKVEAPAVRSVAGSSGRHFQNVSAIVNSRSDFDRKLTFGNFYQVNRQCPFLKQ